MSGIAYCNQTMDTIIPSTMCTRECLEWSKHYPQSYPAPLRLLSALQCVELQEKNFFYANLFIKKKENGQFQKIDAIPCGLKTFLRIFLRYVVRSKGLFLT
jgi:hypothetical protein